MNKRPSAESFFSTYMPYKKGTQRTNTANNTKHFFIHAHFIRNQTIDIKLITDATKAARLTHMTSMTTENKR